MLSRHFLVSCSVRTVHSSTYHLMPKKKSKKAVSDSHFSAVKQEEGPVCRSNSGIKIQILAKPGAKTNSITDISTVVGIQIAAPPVDGEANLELVKYLSKVLNLKKTHISIDKGFRSRSKTVIVNDSTTEYVLQRLHEEMS